MHSILEEEETDAVPLIDASYAFKALNRAATLHNIRVLCPSIATNAINTYRQSSRLLITGERKLKSAEGTTQRGPLAMAINAISLQPLITRLISPVTRNNAGMPMMQVVPDLWKLLSNGGTN